MEEEAVEKLWKLHGLFLIQDAKLHSYLMWKDRNVWYLLENAEALNTVTALNSASGKRKSPCDLYGNGP